MASLQSSKARRSAREIVRSERPLLIGHRGYCEVAPENTLPSFERALEAGADLVELDYRHSRDGVAMVVHDATLDRTTDVRSRWRRSRVEVAATTAAEMRTLDAGSWFDPNLKGTCIPLLSEALELIVAGGRTALVEHKSGDAASCAKLLRERGLADRVIVISFDWAYVREFHELAPDQVLGALGPATRLAAGHKPSRISGKLSREWLDELGATGAEIVVWNRRVTKEAIEAAHQRGLRVWIYTVNAARLAKQLLDRGVDGIITNRIAPIRKVLTGRAA
jgi:glycerophosphoryl diester phosphodiesterase